MKTIVLNRGFVTTVDDEDFEMLSAYKWMIHEDRKRPLHKYAVAYMTPAKGAQQKTIRMHRLIMGVTDPKIFVDHKDHDGLNNQKHNLRICSLKQNCQNIAKTNPDGTRKLKGVRRYNKRYGAYITANGVHHWLGSHDTQEEAAMAYDAKAKELHGEFAYLNYPEHI